MNFEKWAISRVEPSCFVMKQLKLLKCIKCHGKYPDLFYFGFVIFLWGLVDPTCLIHEYKFLFIKSLCLHLQTIYSPCAPFISLFPFQFPQLKDNILLYALPATSKFVLIFKIYWLRPQKLVVNH